MIALPHLKDPLLSTARILLKIMIWGALILAALMFLAIPFILWNAGTITYGITHGTAINVNGHMLTNLHLGAHFILTLIGFLASVGALLLLCWQFLKILAAIVDTVAAGDPLIPENATRLRNLGWLMLVNEFIMIPIVTWSEWQLLTNLGQISPDYHINGSGLLMVLTLFILARVFQQGAAMRQDLEGTV